MQWKRGEYWLRDAVKYIKFPPDRRRVQEELYEHMISRNLDFLAQGCSEEEADRRVCEAMGDPEEVGKALAEVHKPFWGYCLRVLRILLALLVLFAAVTVIRDDSGGLPEYRYVLRMNGVLDERVRAWIPQQASAAAGDYRFRLVKAGITASEPLDDMDFLQEGNWLVLRLRFFTWDPNLGPPQFTYRTLTAEDSGGREYPAFTMGEMDLIFGGSISVLVKDFDPAAEWAVLRFDSGDRSFRMPVHLKGAGE